MSLTEIDSNDKTALFVSESECITGATEGLFAFGEQSEPITQMDSRDCDTERHI